MGSQASRVVGQAPGAPNSGLGVQRSERAFTMIEIALSLAVIGFALVAIVGVLPLGLNVQKQNREETIINQDASVLMNAIPAQVAGVEEIAMVVPPTVDGSVNPYVLAAADQACSPDQQATRWKQGPPGTHGGHPGVGTPSEPRPG